MSFASPNDIPTFLKSRGIKATVAFSGGATTPSAGVPKDVASDLEAANDKFENAIIFDALSHLSLYKRRLAILSGGTKYGVPAKALIAAKKLGFVTIGVLPARGTDQALPPDVVDFCIRVGSEIDCRTPEDVYRFESQWGDETPYFAKLLDGVIVVNGRAGTLIEMAHVLKINEDRQKKKKSLKLIVPIAPTGGTADWLYNLPSVLDTRSACMPERPVSSGQAAAKFLTDRLSLEDLIDDEADQASA